MSTNTNRVDDPEALAEALLDRARRAGADAADVLIGVGESLSVTARGGALEHVERSESIDFGLRALIGGEGGLRQATASASDPSANVIDALVDRAVAMAREAPVDPYAGLAPESAHAPEADRASDAARHEVAADALLDEALALEAAALAVDRVSQVEGADSAWSRSETFLATSSGFFGRRANETRSLSVSAIAGEGLGMESDYAYTMARRAALLRAPEDVGREAGERAARRLDPKPAPTGPAALILEPRVASRIVSSILGAVNGEQVARGASFLRDKMGERILPAGVDLIDDPRREDGLASRAFDGEGVATRTKRVVADGVVAEWLLDMATARQLEMSTNGSAWRSVGGAPSPGASNAWITAGAKSQAELIASVERGVLVTSVMGRGVNGVTGDVSFGASGFWIEKGEIAHPANEFTIAGRIFDWLADLELGADLTFERRVDSPSMKIAQATVAANG